MGIKVSFTGISPEQLARNLAKATKTEVLVGIPRDKAARSDGPISNADIAYIQEHGAPSRNIPPRPFMEPGINRSLDKVRQIMAAGAAAVVNGDSLRPYAEKVGITCQHNIRGVFTDNNWKPLSPRTILARARRTVQKRKGYEDKSEHQQQTMLAKELARRADDRPLIDTGALRQSITYVVTEGGDGQ